MPNSRSMFSDSWHRVARQKTRLRSNLTISRQLYRGETWYILQDPFTNQFFRFRPPAYHFLSLLDGKITLEEAWRRSLDRYPDEAPGQDEVIQLLSQLYQSNLIQSDLSADSRRLFERYKQFRQRQVRSTLFSILFIRIPLWDPDRFLQRTLPFIRPLAGKLGLAVWVVVVGLALIVAAQNFHLLWDRTQEVLAPENLIFLLLSFIAVKALHEFGHAYACRHYGGEVHTMGIMLLVFSPIPFCDATAAWAFRERWKRVMVGLAGMYVELFIAALATFVWVQTGTGMVNSLAYNVMFLASVATILFNINPLLRFDGYYILSDLSDTPNLQTRSRDEIFYYTERYAFGYDRARSASKHRRESAWLVLFGLASAAYRIVIFTVIILFIADKFFGLGLIAAILGGTGLFLVPIYKFTKYLATEPRIQRTRTRAVGVTLAVVGLVFSVLWFLPWPHHFYAPGLLRAETGSKVIAGTTGSIVSLHVESADPVRKDQLLVTLKNPELDYRIQAAEARVAQISAQISNALETGEADLRSLRTRRAAQLEILEELKRRRRDLEIRSPLDGTWVAPRLHLMVGATVDRGMELGEVISSEQFEFEAIVRQQDASRLFEVAVPRSEIRLRGQAGQSIPVEALRLVPSRQDRLPSAALGWGARGPVRTRADDPEGLMTAEPFFRVIASIESSTSAMLLNGQTGWVRFTTEPEPLLRQWIRSFRQLLQSRYQI